MSEDYYAILGVTRNATMNEIKHATKRLRRDLHSDRNKSPEAKERWHEVTKAFETLYDSEERRQYDLKNPIYEPDVPEPEPNSRWSPETGYSYSHVSAWTDLLPPVLQRTEVVFKPVQQFSKSMSQVEVRIDDPNYGELLTPALRSASGQFWHAQLYHDGAYWHLILTTVSAELLMPQMYNDTLEVYWEDRPGVSAKLSVSLAVEPGVPPDFDYRTSDVYVRAMARQNTRRRNAKEYVEPDHRDVNDESKHDEMSETMSFWIVVGLASVIAPAIIMYLAYGTVTTVDSSGNVAGFFCGLWFFGGVATSIAQVSKKLKSR
jgi:hypothetical protein